MKYAIFEKKASVWIKHTASGWYSFAHRGVSIRL